MCQEAAPKQPPAHRSDVRGVTWDKSQKRWQAKLAVNGKKTAACRSSLRRRRRPSVARPTASSARSARRVRSRISGRLGLRSPARRAAVTRQGRRLRPKRSSRPRPAPPQRRRLGGRTLGASLWTRTLARPGRWRLLCPTKQSSPHPRPAPPQRTRRRGEIMGEQIRVARTLACPCHWRLCPKHWRLCPKQSSSRLRPAPPQQTRLRGLLEVATQMKRLAPEASPTAAIAPQRRVRRFAKGPEFPPTTHLASQDRPEKTREGPGVRRSI